MTQCATCGVRVDPSRALRLAEGGTILFFCSAGCRAIYLQRSRRTGTGRRQNDSNKRGLPHSHKPGSPGR